jgi:starch synthase (maltosyl-transferring)
VHWSDDDHILVFSKHRDDDLVDDVVIVVINLDPHATRETTIHLDVQALGLPDTFLVHDEITGADWTWGQHNYVRLDPYHEPAHILSARRPR